MAYRYWPVPAAFGGCGPPGPGCWSRGPVRPGDPEVARRILQLLLGRHLLCEQRGLDAVEQALQPADQLCLGDAQLGVRRRRRAERQRDPVELLDQLGARPALSSSIDRRWISASRVRPASSSGALRTSSRRFLIIDPIRMTLAGCSTRSAGLLFSSSSPSRPDASGEETPMPSWVTTTMRPGWSSGPPRCPAARWSCSDMVDSLSHANGGDLSAPTVQRPPQGRAAPTAPHGRPLPTSSARHRAHRDSPSGWSRMESLRQSRGFRGSSDPQQERRHVVRGFHLPVGLGGLRE